MAKQSAPVRITTAQTSHADDVAARQRRYLISMGIRTACFVAAVLSIGHWFLWVFLLASFLLPTFAVIVANSRAPADPGGPEYFVPDPTVRSLESKDESPPPPPR